MVEMPSNMERSPRIKDMSFNSTLFTSLQSRLSDGLCGRIKLCLKMFDVHNGYPQQYSQTAGKRQIQMFLPFTGFNHLVILPRYA